MVIIDEFSVMSQIIAESILTIDDNYANKLQLLLSKGAAMGLHFLFSSQGFTTGTRGLTDFSKLQIQQRIAMKTGFQEIRETLDIKSSSDADNRMMEQLDYHYALVRVPMDEHGNRLKSSHVLYIRDYNEQEAMIDALNKSVQAQTKYALEQPSAYINKQPVIVDGSVYVPFQSSQAKIQQFLYSKPLEPDECAIFPGIPMRLIALQPVIVSDEFSHNILLIAKTAERQPTASLLISCFESLAMQGKKVEIWASRKDPIFLQIRPFAQQKHYTIRTDLNMICEEILHIKHELETGETLKRYYVLLGFTSFLTDMKYRLQGSSPSSNRVTHPQVSYEPRKTHELDLMTQLKLAKEGKALPVVPAIPAPPQTELNNDSVKFHAQSAYDARQDLKFLLVNGPSLGIHFMAQFSNMAEYSQSGLDSELFRHKFVFRVSKREVSGLIGTADAAVAEQLQSHSFRYTNGLNSLSYRPYLHPGLSWDGWVIQDGKAINISDEEETYLL